MSASGVHLFDRVSGVNVLLDEVRVPAGRFSRAPRYLSVALTNACELRCAYCYAPKHAAALDRERVLAWAVELDAAGCLGVGFGGGEPTAYRRFAQLCSEIAQSTSIAVTFTTHGHRLTPELVSSLRGAVHFVRLSVDGVGTTYERLRGRPFAAVVQAAGLLSSLAPFGINAVINADTVGELDDLAAFADEVGASNCCSCRSSPPRLPPASATPTHSASSNGPQPHEPRSDSRFPVPVSKQHCPPQRPSPANFPSTRTCISTRPASSALTPTQARDCQSRAPSWTSCRR